MKSHTATCQPDDCRCAPDKYCEDCDKELDPDSAAELCEECESARAASECGLSKRSEKATSGVLAILDELKEAES